MIEVGGVYRLYCYFTNPTKERFCACVSIDPQELFFLVRTSIPNFAKKKPDLYRQYHGLKKSNYGFLDYNSWIYCGETNSFDAFPARGQVKDDTSRNCGRLTQIDLLDIKLIVTDSLTIPEIRKKAIIRNIKSVT